jgi:hypothetical protein
VCRWMLVETQHRLFLTNLDEEALAFQAHTHLAAGFPSCLCHTAKFSGDPEMPLPCNLLSPCVLYICHFPALGHKQPVTDPSRIEYSPISCSFNFSLVFLRIMQSPRTRIVISQVTEFDVCDTLPIGGASMPARPTWWHSNKIK